MAKRHTEYHPRAAGTVNAPDFERDFAAQASIVNGGLDRANLPYQTFDHDNIVDYAFQKVLLSTNIELASAFQVSNGGAGHFSCLNYEAYTGGWVEHATYTLDDCHEGMLLVDFSCWAFCLKFQTLNSPKRTLWRITVNGEEVATTAGIYPTFSNPRVCACVPVAGGTVVVGLSWKYTGYSPGDDSIMTNEMLYGGGVLFARGIWR